MEDHQSDGNSFVEERDERMVPPSGGNPTYRKAHFLKPIFTRDHLHLPPSHRALLASKPTLNNLEKSTLQSYKGLPCPLASVKWKFWVQSLKPKYQEIWKKAGIYEAILASTYTIPKDKKLLICLSERWCVDTNTFVFPWGEVTITLEDVIHLGCFSVLGASFLTPLDDECNDIFKCLEYELKKVRLGHSNNALPYAWMDYFMSSGNQLEHEAFLVCWLSKFVLVHSQIAVKDFHVAIHLSRGNRMALAPVVLACIYRDMRLAHNSIIKSVALESSVGLKFNTCHYDLVQMWVWERFMELRPVLKVIGSGEPRSARWNGVTNLKVNDVRAALDSAGFSFLWRPYALGPSNNMLSTLYKDIEQWVVVESDAVESFARCLRASELVGSCCVEQYLPNRVAMQFGLDQDLPSHVVRSNESPQIAWNSYNRPIRGLKLYIPARLFESDVSSRYVGWWTGDEVVISSIHNEKQFPLVSCRQERNVKYSAIPGAFSDCDEERQEDYGGKGVLSSAQQMSGSRKTDISGKRNDLSLRDDPVLFNSYDNAEEDNLTIAQILNQSKNTESADKRNDLEDFLVLENSFQNVKEDSLMTAQFLNQSRKRTREISDDIIPNTVTPGLFSVCHESPKKLSCTSEPGKLSAQNMPWSYEREKSRSSTKRQTELQDANVTSNDNTVSINEVRCEDVSELQQLGLEARICRLETIVSMIKGAKNGASSS